MERQVTPWSLMQGVNHCSRLMPLMREMLHAGLKTTMGKCMECAELGISHNSNTVQSRVKRLCCCAIDPWT